MDRARHSIPAIFTTLKVKRQATHRLAQVAGRMDSLSFQQIHQPGRMQMCDICVMNAVKDRMLSRRGFFKAAAASGIAVAATGAAAPIALAAGHGQVEDMTHTAQPRISDLGRRSRHFRRTGVQLRRPRVQPVQPV